jgi:hypothetical protein
MGFHSLTDYYLCMLSTTLVRRLVLVVKKKNHPFDKENKGWP